MSNMLTQLPFVDGIPDDGQRRLSWIHNGDHLVGADKKLSNEGNLNILSVQLQKNIVFLAENLGLLSESQALSAEEIVKIKEILDQAGTEGLIDLVNTNTHEIALLKTANEEILRKIKGNADDIETLNQSIGVRDEAQGINTVFADLLFIKRTIGNKAGETINGNPSPGTLSSGLILKLEDVTKQAIKNRDDIVKINEDLNNGDIPELHKRVDDIRLELGTKPAISVPTVYVRLKSLEDTDIELQSEIDTIRQDIGPGKLVTRVNTNSTNIGKLQAELDGPDGLKVQIDAIDAKLDTPGTGIEARLAKVTTESGSTTTIVGKTANDGLQKSVKEIRTTLGMDETSVPAISVLGRLDLLESVQGDSTAAIQGIEVTLGTSTTGLQGQVATNTKAIVGDSLATDPVEKAGLMASTKAMRTMMNDIGDVSAAILEKMPYKGKSLVLLNDKTTNITNKNVCDKSYILPWQDQVQAAAGIASISQDNKYANAKNADMVLINVGTYDYLFDTELGTIADATSGNSSGSFYNELYKLLVDIAGGKARVFMTNGYRVVKYADTTVKYPAANTLGKKLDDYSTAINEVAAMFSVPVLDTNNKLGINTHNSTQFFGDTGFVKIGVDRFATVVSNFLLAN